MAAEATPVADRLNMTYAGSIVTRGRAKGLVVATGTATSVGQLALDVLGETGGQPPLLVRMERFTHVIAVAVLVAAASIGTLGRDHRWLFGCQRCSCLPLPWPSRRFPKGCRWR